MPPSDKEFDFLADRLAEDISTVEEQLVELGASFLTTADLVGVRGRLMERMENFEYFQKKMVRLAIYSPLLLAIGAGLLFLGVPRLGALFLVGFPVVLFVCLGGVFSLYQRFGNRGKIEQWLEEVEEELKKRQRKG